MGAVSSGPWTGLECSAGEGEWGETVRKIDEKLGKMIESQ